MQPSAVHLREAISLHPTAPTYLRVKVIPRQPRTEFIDIREDETVRIRLRAVPEKWQANKELIRFLSDEFSVAKGDIEIVAGTADPVKLVRIGR